MLLDEYCDSFCICPKCSKLISYEEAHRNDTEPGFVGLCYECEKNEREKYGRK